jgi:hypothetical protein
MIHDAAEPSGTATLYHLQCTQLIDRHPASVLGYVGWTVTPKDLTDRWVV